jgi:hypothetical protein
MPIESSGSPAAYPMPMRPNLAVLRLCAGTAVPLGCPLGVAVHGQDLFIGFKKTDLFIVRFDE